MIQLPAQLKILIAIAPVDFRRGIDGLAAVCRQQLLEDPFSGRVYIFRNRSGTAVKILTYDQAGFWLIQKRFSRGRLRWWPNADGSRLTPLAAIELQILLSQGDPGSARLAPAWHAWH